MAIATAKPKAAPPPPRKPSSTETATAILSGVTVVQTKGQEDFEAEANEFAAACGWEGDPSWVLNGVQNSDARNYFRKVFHELHIAALNPARAAPTVEGVCFHLGITDADTIAVVKGRLDQILAREKGKPTSPTS